MRKIILLISLFFVLSCSTHENFPEPHDIQVPPTVSNLSVTHPSDLLYTLDWDINPADTTNVDHYNVYVVGTYGAPEFLGTTGATIVDVTIPFPLANIIFGVSVVTKENVEGRLVYAVAPD